MPAKLLKSVAFGPLRQPPPLPRIFGNPGLPVLYANLDFGNKSAKRKTELLLKSVGSIWRNDKRTFNYLRTQQKSFRQCLDWLSKGAVIRFEHVDEGTDPDLLWSKSPEVRFLQQHGLEHGNLTLEPCSLDEAGPPYHGFEIEMKRARDPLDPICWHLFSELIWNGRVGVSRCKYQVCGKFFRPPSPRRVYCSANCRAKRSRSTKGGKEQIHARLPH
jgi:hypothetical protein